MTGEVTGMYEYGVFVNIIDGVDAITRPISKRAYHDKPIHVGDKVDIKITDNDYIKEQINGKIIHIEK